MSFKDFFKKAKLVSIGNNEIGFMEIDAVMTETHTMTAQISENEIEDDGTLVDNYKIMPKKVQLNCIISDVPISLEDSLLNAPTSFLSSRLGGLGTLAAQAGLGILSQELLKKSKSRQHDNLKKIEEFMENRARLTVSTGLKIYQNMMIENVSFPKNAKIGDSLQFDISLKEVRIVESKTVALPEVKTKGKSGHSATSKADLGKQKTTEATAGQASKVASDGKSSSLLFKAFGS